ncbi:unnamed protein product [Kuraishia capsulata CBS 1993]|uniref:Major facilitator superfamily (MFS) profile domain-containing protein n=1 Tax=Kuraishia capsulata CBS 1993 TaxID=1382522 RepID=W6MNP4_9ASCO|nr:uncharacterized protein KUCA_T00004271001 [Kuraishia capsulata CBS 1993]CDK28289.1 unnamed protein product [Kuraishia capsulata CBS 1993]
MVKEIAIKDQTNVLPKKKLLITFASLALGLLASFLDQNSLAVSLPDIGKDLHATNTTSWAGTSLLIANTTFQVLFGRLSDIFGRKVVLLGCMSILCLSQLATCFCNTSTQLYVFRGFAGIGNGGIQSLTMMIVSDVVTLEERGKYQGILGTCVGLGNAVGPFIAAGFLKSVSWKGVYYFLCPLTALVTGVSMFVIPQSSELKVNYENFKKIDFYGFGSSSTGIILFLVGLSGGGNVYAWNSPTVICLLTIGAVFLLLFLFTQWKLSRLPMMPLRLFSNISVAIMLLQGLLFGLVYYSNVYFIPLYCELVRGMKPSIAACMSLPYLIIQAVVSTVCGALISKYRSYGFFLYFGYTVWFLGTGLQIMFDQNLSIVGIIFILLCQGVGVGCIFQPTIVALQAHCRKPDRAVVISIRNFMRSMGGSIGLAASSAILSNVLSRKLRQADLSDLTQAELNSLIKSVYSRPDLTKYSTSDQKAIRGAIAGSMRTVFIFFTPIMGVVWLMGFFIIDRGLQRPEDAAQQKLEQEAKEAEKLVRVDSSEHSVRSKNESTAEAGGKDLVEES